MKTKTRDLTKLERDILRLKRKGLTYLAISRKLNIPKSTAHEIFSLMEVFKKDE